MKIKKITCAIYTIVAFAPLAIPAADPVNKPNILIFYVDDLGWQDIELNDIDEPTPYETPNILRLAEQGVNFTQGYASAPTCSPSRAGIITGQHPGKLQFSHVHLGLKRFESVNSQILPPFQDSHLDPDLLTLADALNENGYRTGHSGKWHVGQTSAEYGFDVVNQDRGVHRGMTDRTTGFATVDDSKYPLSEEKYAPFSDKNPEGISYPLDEVTESAIRFMEESKDEPFFLNLCHWMVHYPILTRNGALLEHYCDKLGQPFPPEPGAMTLPGQQNPYFASMVTTVDWSLGRVMDYLEETDDPRHPGKKLIETTYIFYTSDNGGAEKKSSEIISDNFPLKNGKVETDEGGIRVPTVISGPTVVKGATIDTLVNQLDFFPTILELTESTLPSKDEEELDGLDISSILSGDSDEVLKNDGTVRKQLFWHFPHQRGSFRSAIRKGDYKLYLAYESGEYELFRLYRNGLRDDLEEEVNLAQDPKFSNVLTNLSESLQSELAGINAVGPYLNPEYKNNELETATLDFVTYDSSRRLIRLVMARPTVGVKEAYVLYHHESEFYRYTTITGKSLPLNTKVPAYTGLDGSVVGAVIPEEIESFSFVYIDNNNFLHYSDVYEFE